MYYYVPMYIYIFIYLNTNSDVHTSHEGYKHTYIIKQTKIKFRHLKIALTNAKKSQIDSELELIKAMTPCPVDIHLHIYMPAYIRTVSCIYKAKGITVLRSFNFEVNISLF